jgi:hypothetical protein
VVLDGHLRVVEAEPAHGSLRSPAACRRLQPLHGQLQEVAADLARPRIGNLLGRLGEVAEVRQEAAQTVTSQDRGGVRAGEAGQPADVDEAGDEQGVELALGESLGDLLGPVGDRGGAHVSSSDFSRARASP